MTDPSPPAPSEDHLVHEAIGPALTPVHAGAALGVGVNSLLVLGVFPSLLGALADEHRLSAAGIGQAAMLELLAMAIATGLAAMVLPARRLRLIGAATSIALAAVNLAGLHAGGPLILALRAAAGTLEGVLLWITIGMIARTVTPERWAGVFFTVQTLAQLILAFVLSTFVMGRYGADGALVALALCSLAGLAPALLCPERYAPLPLAPGTSIVPPPRGWAALVAVTVYVAAAGAVSVYLQPLAHQAGLSAAVARTANWTALAAQVAGGAMATALAGRVRWFTVFIATTVTSLTVWWLFARAEPAWLFVLANSAAGLMTVFLGPFLVPMMIDADPTRRAALQSGAAQLLGGAIGPFLAALTVDDRDVRSVLWLGAGLALVGLAGVAALRFTRSPSAEAAPVFASRGS